MALFPKCNLRILPSNGVVVAGARFDGILDVEAVDDIPRADHIHLFFHSKAWAGYGSGKNRRVYRSDLYIAPLFVDLPKGVPLARGSYRYPFTLHIPPWLPPNLVGPDCAIEHVIEARLDVDWAVDPTTRTIPVVVHPPREAKHTPATIRSPVGFHEEIVIEVSLGSTQRSPDEPLSGTIALRGGHSARFDAVIVSLQSVTTITMVRGDRRAGGGLSIRIPAEHLRSGVGVPFTFPPESGTGMPPTFRNGFIDHDVVLKVSVDVPWALDPWFEIPIQALPRGSTLYGDANAAAVGGERLRNISMAMAHATGLRPGRPPAFIEGSVGPALLHVSDGPREGRLGVDVDIQFPEVDLGITLRPLGVLEGFRESPLLPSPLGGQYLLRVAAPEEGRPPVSDEALRPFFANVLGNLHHRGPPRPAPDTPARGVEELQLTDHQLRMHFRMANDGTDQMVEVARFAQARTKAILDAIAALPFPAGFETARPSWQATAAEQNAFLVPSGPSLHGLLFRSRIVGGEERVIGITICTSWREGKPLMSVNADLRSTPISKDACIELERGSDRLRGVRAVFPEAHAFGPERIVLEQPGFAADPRALLPGIEALFFWILDSRSERRADQPYR